jgi:hypothetical protein
VGGFAKKRIDAVQKNFFSRENPKDTPAFSTAQILHPSPANPLANSGWGESVTETLKKLKIWK